VSWKEFHSQSERLAIDAALADKGRQFETAKRLYREAAQLERKALEALDSSKLRTRGITAVSAVALWFKASAFVESEQLAYKMLSDETTPDFARVQLRNLVQAIWTEATKQQANVQFLPGQVFVAVKGGDVVTGGAPLDLIVDKVKTIQSLFYRTIEYLSGTPHRRTGAPAKELQESCRPWLFQTVPGSYQFSVSIQSPTQPDFFKDQVQPERIARHFLDIVQATADDSMEQLQKLVVDADYRGTFLKLSRTLAPTGKQHDRIELRGATDGASVTLVPESRKAISAQIKNQAARPIKTDGQQVELRGVLRAVHLDRDWLDILVDGKSIHVVDVVDTVDDVIGPMVNRVVTVTAIKTNTDKVTYVDIELAD
jgi:hypothetical protein